jgi:hypothetical protein
MVPSRKISRLRVFTTRLAIWLRETAGTPSHKYLGAKKRAERSALLIAPTNSRATATSALSFAAWTRPAPDVRGNRSAERDRGIAGATRERG